MQFADVKTIVALIKAEWKINDSIDGASVSTEDIFYLHETDSVVYVVY